MICIETMLGRCIHADNGGWGSVRQPASHSRLGGPSARRQSHRRWPSPVIVAATQVHLGASFEERPGFGVSGASSQQSHQPMSVHSAQGTCTAVHSRVRRQTFASGADGQSLSHDASRTYSSLGTRGCSLWAIIEPCTRRNPCSIEQQKVRTPVRSML